MVALCTTQSITNVRETKKIPNSLLLNISDLEEVTSDQETRLTEAEENIQGDN